MLESVSVYSLKTGETRIVSKIDICTYVIIHSILYCNIKCILLCNQSLPFSIFV